MIAYDHIHIHGRPLRIYLIRGVETLAHPSFPLVGSVLDLAWETSARRTPMAVQRG
jgi:hypothetical protein